MKTNVSWATNDDSRSAGKSVAKKAVLDLEKTQIAFLFNSSNYEQDQVLNGAKEELGTAPIIGCTTNQGVFTQEGFISSSDGFSGMLAFGDNGTEVTTGACKRLVDARDSAKLAVAEALKKHSRKGRPNYCFMFCTPGSEEEYQKGIFETIGSIPIFGGVASSNQEGQEKVFTENALITDGVAIALVYSDKNIDNWFDGKYHETVKSGIITDVSSNHRVIKQIDSKDAFKIYSSWNNKKLSEMKTDKLYQDFILHPLGIKTVDGSNTIIRQPISITENNGIEVNENVYINNGVIKMTTTKEELLEAPSFIIKQFLDNLRVEGKEVNSLILLHSGKRLIDCNEEDISFIADSLKDATNKIPFIMPLTHGEFGVTDTGSNLCGDLMMTFIAICNN